VLFSRAVQGIPSTQRGPHSPVLRDISYASHSHVFLYRNGLRYPFADNAITVDRDANNSLTDHLLYLQLLKRGERTVMLLK
jgi:hypothetical protein